MTGTRLCLSLLFVGVLLLGQPAWGADEEPEEAESEGGGKGHCCRGPVRALTSDEENEERARNMRRRLKNEEDHYLRDYFKSRITDYFNEQHSKDFYKVYEDAQLKIKDAPGFIMEFTIYMVKTNCTRDVEDHLAPLERRNRKYDHIIEESLEDLSDCHPLSGEDKAIQKCTFSMYFGGNSNGRAYNIVGHRCKEVQIVEED